METAEQKKQGQTKKGNGEVATGELMKRSPTDAAIQKYDLDASLKEAGFDVVPGELETIRTGGVTKWLDLSAFQADPNAAQGVPVKGNGMWFAGILKGRQEIADENGEENADGVKVRYFYTLELLTPCAVTYKDEDNNTQKMIANKGEVIAVGERAALRDLATLATDGGTYAIIIKPDSRIKIKGGHTMWTFYVGKKVIRPPRVVLTKAPF